VVKRWAMSWLTAGYRSIRRSGSYQASLLRVEGGLGRLRACDSDACVVVGGRRESVAATPRCWGVMSGVDGRWGGEDCTAGMARRGGREMG
jgi:hypothetical protein